MFLIRIVLTLCVAASLVEGKPVIIDDDDFCSTVDDSEEHNGFARVGLVALWPNGVVPYTFADCDFMEEGKEYIEWAMGDLEQYGVQFKFRTDEDDYVEFTRDKTKGCFSEGIGRIGGKQTVNLGKRCMETHIILHELMHVLGFNHEQNRSDRDKYVKIMFENIKKREHHNFEKHRTPKIYDKVPYDFESIMHYGATAFSKNDEPTIVPREQYAEYATEMGHTREMSALDIKKLEILYPPSVDLSELSESSESNESSGYDSDYWLY